MSCPRHLFDRVIWTFGDFTFSHHALAHMGPSADDANQSGQSDELSPPTAVM
jgi:hypothetical protein